MIVGFLLKTTEVHYKCINCGCRLPKKSITDVCEDCEGVVKRFGRPLVV